MTSVLHELTSHDLGKIKSMGSQRSFLAGERIFSEGDEADYIHFIESGRVSIFIDKFNSRQEIGSLGPGECFGEMAVFFKDRRTASAQAKLDSVCLSLAKADFLELLKVEKSIAERINHLLALRNEELLLREKLLDAGMGCGQLHIGIKGDPSLRESALSRERHESVVDKILPALAPKLEELLLRRCAYQIYIGFNSGEIRVASILDPFNDEFHPATRLLDETYLDRHFPAIGYEQKMAVIRRQYQAMRNDPYFGELPPHLGKVLGDYYLAWQPVAPDKIAQTIAQLPLLREIPNYYIRNTTISIIKDAIHMQFNCDGSHIVSRKDYERFLEENL